MWLSFATATVRVTFDEPSIETEPLASPDSEIVRAVAHLSALGTVLIRLFEPPEISASARIVMLRSSVEIRALGSPFEPVNSSAKSTVVDSPAEFVTVALSAVDSSIAMNSPPTYTTFLSESNDTDVSPSLVFHLRDIFFLLKVSSTKDNSLSHISTLA